MYNMALNLSQMNKVFVRSTRSIALFQKILFRPISLTRKNISPLGRKSNYKFVKSSAIGFSLTLIPFFTVKAFSFTRSKETPKFKMESMFKEADDLYSETDYKKIVTLLEPYLEKDNEEVLWRMARAVFEMAKLESNKTEKQNMNKQAFAFAEKALAVNDNNFASHKWYAILLDTVSEYEGTKARIVESEKVKHHIKRATELNPEDATSYHMLGIWCFSVADLPWYQRKIAAVVYATPPTSSYEEALNCFLQAEKIEPNFYSKNLLMIGKTYLKMNDKEKAHEYLTMAKDYNVRTEDDKQAQAEAEELLKGLK